MKADVSYNSYENTIGRTFSHIRKKVGNQINQFFGTACFACGAVEGCCSEVPSRLKLYITVLIKKFVSCNG